MSLPAWANKKIRNLTYWDMQLIKLSVIGFTLMIAKLWKPLLSLEWYWYAIIFVLASIKPVCAMLKK